MKKYVAIVALAGVFASCGNNGNEADAYGQFEADEILISAEASGKLLSFKADEGVDLNANESAGLIDTTQLYLKKGQLKSSIAAIEGRMPNVAAQIKVYDEQLLAAERELKRAKTLLAEEAATQKQVDDLSSQVTVLKSQRSASLSNLSDQNQSLLGEASSLGFQQKQVEDQLAKCRIVNPVKGTVLSTYVEPGELVGVGKPLYRLANLEELTLRAYVSGDQLVNLKIGQEVKVRVDRPNGEYSNFSGKLSWISPEAEFTPKVIQTKEDRVNLVYALKIKVANDGSLKIGMPGEVLFSSDGQD